MSERRVIKLVTGQAASDGADVSTLGDLTVQDPHAPAAVSISSGN